jgi:hypothetical protein
MTMSEQEFAAWQNKVDRVVQRTATKISTALDKMVSELPENAAPQWLSSLW